MKIQSILATAALLGVLATAAHAATFTKSSSFEAPMPAKIVTPTELPSAYRGSTVTLRLKLDATGHPRRELFRADLLHLQPSGYALWTRILRPLLSARHE